MAFNEVVEYFLSKYNLSFERNEQNGYYLPKINLNVIQFSGYFMLYSVLFQIQSWDDEFFNKIALLQITRIYSDKASLVIDCNQNLVLKHLITDKNVSKFLFEKCVEQFLDSQSFWLQCKPGSAIVS